MPENSSRDRIIDAAVEIVDQRGLSAMNIRAVASAAECSPALVIRLFQTRAGLINEMFLRGQSDAIQRALKASGDGGDPVERCMNLFAVMVDIDFERVELRREVMANSWSLNPKLTDCAERELQQVLPLLLDIVSTIESVEAYQDKANLAECLWSRYEAALKKHLRPNAEREALLDDLRRRVRIVFNGAA